MDNNGDEIKRRFDRMLNKIVLLSFAIGSVFGFAIKAPIASHLAPDPVEEIREVIREEMIRADIEMLIDRETPTIPTPDPNIDMMGSK